MVGEGGKLKRNIKRRRREGGRKGRREEGKEGGRKGRREGEKEEGKEGGRKGRREVGREGRRKGGRVAPVSLKHGLLLLLLQWCGGLGVAQGEAWHSKYLWNKERYLTHTHHCLLPVW